MTKTFSHNEVENDFLVREKILNEIQGLDCHEAKNINTPNLMAKLIDSTILKPVTTENDIINIINEDCIYNFRSICIPPCFVNFANLKNTSRICTVIGFPNGYHSTKIKCREIEEAINEGCQEIDFVQNLTYVKSNKYNLLETEFRQIVECSQNKVTKVILETSLLNESEIYKCSLIAAQSGVHIIKTSTGFGTRGASLNDIKIIKAALFEHFEKTGIQLGIKASGGIKTQLDAIEFIHHGATRLGTSNGKLIIEGKKAINNY